MMDYEYKLSYAQMSCSISHDTRYYSSTSRHKYGCYYRSYTLHKGRDVL